LKPSRIRTTATRSFRLLRALPSLSPADEERDGADDLHLDVGQVSRKPLFESSLVIFEVRKIPFRL
jgi:hypothetical protein